MHYLQLTALMFPVVSKTNLHSWFVWSAKLEEASCKGCGKTSMSQRVRSSRPCPKVAPLKEQSLSFVNTSLVAAVNVEHETEEFRSCSVIRHVLEHVSSEKPLNRLMHTLLQNRLGENALAYLLLHATQGRKGHLQGQRLAGRRLQMHAQFACSQRLPVLGTGAKSSVRVNT